jgi:hypothetical protein
LFTRLEHWRRWFHFVDALYQFFGPIFFQRHRLRLAERNLNGNENGLRERMIAANPAFIVHQAIETLAENEKDEKESRSGQQSRGQQSLGRRLLSGEKQEHAKEEPESTLPTLLGL